jgi:hypothetical protein
MKRKKYDMNVGLEYLCPKRSFVKPVIENFLAKRKSRRKHVLSFHIGG